MQQLPHKYIPLNTGTDDSNGLNGTYEGIIDAKNADFSQRGTVITRQGFNSINDYIIGGESIGQALTATSVAQYWNVNSMFTVKDSLSESAGLIMNGRTFVFDGTRWVDRLGAMPLQVKRLTSMAPATLNPGRVDLGAPTPETYIPIISETFGQEGPLSSVTTTLGPDGAPAPATSALSGTTGLSTTARCGTTVAAVSVDSTNHLVMYYKVDGNDTITRVSLDVSVAIPTGHGDCPVICCDFNSASFYILYQTTGNNLLLGKYSVTGALQATTTVVGLGAQMANAYWVTNSSVADNVVVACWTQRGASNGFFSAVLNATTLASLGINKTISTQAGDSCVCGVAAGGQVYLAFSDWLVASSAINIFKRSTSAATQTTVYSYSGSRWDVGLFASQSPFGYMIQHQPILYKNRILMGICHRPAPGSTTSVVSSPFQPYGCEACTWVVVDLGDLFDSSGSGTGGATSPSGGGGSFNTITRGEPQIVARGPTEGSCQPWNPSSACLTADGSYVFASIDWTNFVDCNIVTYHTSLDYQPAAIVGYNGSLAMNKISVLRPQTASMGDTTVIAGSVPHFIARGKSYELGWVENRPRVYYFTAGGSGSLAAGQYGIRAVWVFTDESGQVHRSEPSLYMQPTVILNDEIVVQVAIPQLTEHSLQSIEIYATELNPTSQSPFYYQGSITSWSGSFGGFFLTSINKVSKSPSSPSKVGQILYTDGNTFANQYVSMDGGCTTVADRMWASDGRNVYASKLNEVGEPPTFFANGALTVAVPATNGRVVGLASSGDTVYILSERGIFVVAGDGPDNTGQGQDFITPRKISDVGLLNQRSLAVTPSGVWFAANNTNLNSAGQATIGGLYNIQDKTVKFANQRIQNHTTRGIYEIVYVPERDQLVVVPVYYLFDNSEGPIVLDLRANQFSVWTSAAPPAALQVTMSVAKGLLYSFTNEADKWSSSYNSDVTLTGSGAVRLTLTLQGVKPYDMGGWGRIRRIKLFGSAVGGGYSVFMSAVYDLESDLTASSPTFTLQPAVGTFPSNRFAPEWFPAIQKCSTINLTISTNGPTILHGIEVQYRPLNRAPARQRG